ncbi:MAG TPA: Mov34/MPN/PAD-1 family protein [Chloroflexota bacterium]|nr:Mov34/MPN/PAD-1 family protein [Chloroflexota bacterium]HUM67333.1 Mov34/MPN/PAD-1 family protein [Chloroflexota bacterium]
MFANLVTYHVHKQNPLPPSDALAYQYILAGNGLFIRAETHFFEAILPIAPCTVRGLAPLRHHFRLKVPRIPDRLLDTVLANARRARRPDGGLNEVLYQFHHHGQTVQVKKPAQQATPTSVLATGMDDPAIICDLHSHGPMRAFFSQTDDADEQSARIFAVIGKLDTEPEIRLRVGVYGYWQPLPVTAVFTGTGSFKDLYLKEK